MHVEESLQHSPDRWSDVGQKVHPAPMQFKEQVPESDVVKVDPRFLRLIRSMSMAFSEKAKEKFK